MQIERERPEQISENFFDKCQDLAFIQRPFYLTDIRQQYERRDINSEFELIRALTETKRHKTKLRINSILQNKKNRYPEQSIYEHSRIVLPEADEESTYINANEIPLCKTKRIIITQAPLESTQEDFEFMLQQEGIQFVIMLCNILENGKVRCFDYLLNRKVEKVKEIDNYIEVSRVEVLSENEDDYWGYTHIHYSQWPDRGLPEDPEHLRQVIEEAIKYQRIAIHCSAGLGRSGVLAAALILQLKAKDGEKISVFEMVRRMREYRYGAVQNSEQYKFIYQYLCKLSDQFQ